MAAGPTHNGWRRDIGNSRLSVYVDGTEVALFNDTVSGSGGNLYMGAETAFATTDPTSAVVFKSGTAAAGAIVTSSAIFASDTVLRKIIADGTVSNIQA